MRGRTASSPVGRIARARRVWLARAALTLSPLLALCAIELPLRLYVKLRDSGRALPSDAEIVCVGDSNTEGAGAPRYRDYPGQLEQLLLGTDHADRVANLGKSGSNSTQALRGLESWLNSGHHPRVVIFLAGNNDGWNLSEVDSDDLRGPVPALARWGWLQGLRTYQVFRAALLRARAALRGPDAALSLIAAREWERAEALLREKRRPSKTDLLLLAVAQLQRENFLESWLSYRRFLNADRASSGISLAPALNAGLVDDELTRLASLQGGPHPKGLFLRPPAPNSLADETVVYRLGRGWWALARGRADEAQGEFSALRVAAGMHSLDRALALEGLGWCRLKQGRPAAAAAYFRRAIADGDDPTPQAHLFWSRLGSAIAAWSQGDDAAARDRLGAARGREDGFASRRAGAAAVARLLGRSTPEDERILREAPAGSAPLLLYAALGRRDLPSLPLPPVSYLTDRQYLLLAARLRIHFQLMERNIRRLRDLAAERGFQPILLTYPQAVDAEINRHIRRVGQETGLPVVDLEPVFRSAPQGLISTDGYHPNEKGYGVIAEAVGRALPPAPTSGP